jgi:hypothetical protein
LEDQNARKVNAMPEQKKEMVFQKVNVSLGQSSLLISGPRNAMLEQKREMVFQKVNVSLDQTSLLISGL